MGCDGGTIPKRAELVNTKKKPVKEKDEKNAWLWRTCSLTQLVFEPPVVSCFLGKFYNKCAVIDALLNKSPVLPQHIKRLKDIKDLKLTPNPAFKPSAEKGDEYIDCHLAPYICPVVGIEMNGKFRFVFLWGCGCVMSERALKEVKSKLCLKCQQPFSEDDIIILNPTPEDLEVNSTRLEARQACLKAGNKAGKAQYKGQGMKSSLPTKRQMGSDIEDPVFKKTRSSYSVASDPEATDVFKSLFTSHQKAQQQTKAHWITYNPFYN